MKNITCSFLCVFTLFLCSTLNAYAENNISNKISNPSSSSISSQLSAIQPLTVIRFMTKFQPVDGVVPFGNYWVDYGSMKNTINGDLSKNLGLAYSLIIGEKTKFTKTLPVGYEPQKLLEWGKYPGLNMDILHKHGFTGKGAVVAYIDLPMKEHEQYTRDNVHYIPPFPDYKVSTQHGAAVLSLLAGKDIGTAPEAEVYYYSTADGEDSFMWVAKNLNAIIEKNKTLEDNKKIRMVGLSLNIDDTNPYADMAKKAVKACEEAGIMVWFCGEYGAFSFIPYCDRNSFNGLVPEIWWNFSVPELVCVPTAGRTSATSAPDNYKYIYWSKGGLSWAMPYVLGLYAIALEINPSLTQNDLRKMIVDTAYINFDQIPIINPVDFVAAVLKSVGRDAEAQVILDEAKARIKYLYAVMNTTVMTEKDLTAVGDYLACITDARVLTVDAAKYTDEQSLCFAIQQDAKQRGGSVAGIQVFGNNEMVFELKNNSLISNWSIARLPIGKGEFESFLNKFKAYSLGLDQEPIGIKNFAVVEPNIAAMSLCDSKGYINQSPEQLKKLYKLVRKNHSHYDHRNKIAADGNPLGDEKTIKYETINKLPDGNNGTIYSVTAQPLDNDYIRFTIEYSVPENLYFFIFDLSEKIDLDANILVQIEKSVITLLPKTIKTAKGKGKLVFDLCNEDIAEVSNINVLFTNDQKGGYLVYFKTDQLK